MGLFLKIHNESYTEELKTAVKVFTGILPRWNNNRLSNRTGDVCRRDKSWYKTHIEQIHQLSELI